MKMHFLASGLSVKAKTVTALFFLIILVIILFLIFNNPDSPLFLKLVIVSVFVLVLLMLYLMAPVGYTLTESDLILQRRVGSGKIPLSTVREVRRVRKKDFFRGTVRGGVGGVFGFFGKIFSWEIGVYDAYFTNENKAVLIRSERTVIVSPEDPDLFVRKLSEMIQRDGAEGRS